MKTVRSARMLCNYRKGSSDDTSSESSEFPPQRVGGGWR